MSSRYTPALSTHRRLVWPLLVAYSLVVCVLHFGGLAYDVYTRLWWWDLLTHSLSGIGVAAWLCLVPVVPVDARRPAAVVLTVLAIGAGFEVYEYLFKSFYVEWTAAYYAADTVIDLVVDSLGALAFVRWHERRSGERAPSTARISSEPAD
jgi:hypothetical protein